MKTIVSGRLDYFYKEGEGKGIKRGKEEDKKEKRGGGGRFFKGH